jgi:hypothetical protein
MSWVGDLEEEYTKRAEIFSKRSRRGSQHARAFARAAEAHLRRFAEAEGTGDAGSAERLRSMSGPLPVRIGTRVLVTSRAD